MCCGDRDASSDCGELCRDDDIDDDSDDEDEPLRAAVPVVVMGAGDRSERR